MSADFVLLNEWYPLVRSRDLQPGTILRSRLFDVELVIWRGTDPTVMIWEDRCPHRSVRLSGGTVVENTIACPYHGIVYNAQGQCVKVPAHPDYVPPKQACVRSFPVQERYGVVFVSLGAPTTDVLDFPELNDPNSHNYLSGGHHFRCSGLRAIENFLDLTHLPFVHTGILGVPEQPEIADYKVSTTATGIYLHNIQIWQPDPDGTGEEGIANYDYWTLRPLVVALRKKMSDEKFMVLLYWVTPVSEEECVGWMWGALNYAHDVPEADLMAFQDKVMLQDAATLESHNPKKLPLNSQLEFHLPSDRASLAYRKWLKQLGVRYGAMGE